MHLPISYLQQIQIYMLEFGYVVQFQNNQKHKFKITEKGQTQNV